MYCSNCGLPLVSRLPVTCDACGVTHWTNPKPCAGALVVYDSRLLLVQRSRQPWRCHWDIPGGFCNINEHPSATAEREVFEETGIRIRATSLLGIWMDVYDRADAAQESTMNVYYNAEPTSGVDAQRVDTGEIQAIRWFARDDLPTAIAFPHHSVAVLEAWRDQIAGATGRTAD